MSTDTERSPWKTPAGRARYLAAYDATLALWPVPYEELDVATRFGTTHLIARGPPEAPPFVLFHAMEFSATSWFPTVGELSRNFHVYAVDTLSEIGKSVPSHPLLDPAAAFVPLNRGFFLAAFPGFLWPIHPLLHRSLYAWFVKGFVVNERFAEQFMLGLKHFTLPKLPPLPTVFTEEELRQLNIPTLLLVGEQEQTCNPQAAFNRAKRLIPYLQAEMFPKAGHILSMEQPEIVDARILHFLGQGQEPEAAPGSAEPRVAVDRPPLEQKA